VAEGKLGPGRQGKPGHWGNCHTRPGKPMPTFVRPARLLVAGLTVAVGFAGTSHAGDIFCPFHKDSRGFRGARDFAPGAVYMPTNAPTPQVVGVPIPAARDEALDRAIEAEQYAIKAEAARAAFRAEVEGRQRLLLKLNSLSSSGQTTTAGVPADIESKLRDINDRLDKIATRITDVERLLLIHDNYLQELYKVIPPGATPPPPAPGPTPGPMPMPVPKPSDKKEGEPKPVLLPPTPVGVPTATSGPRMP